MKKEDVYRNLSWPLTPHDINSRSVVDVDIAGANPFIYYHDAVLTVEYDRPGLASSAIVKSVTVSYDSEGWIDRIRYRIEYGFIRVWEGRFWAKNGADGGGPH